MSDPSPEPPAPSGSALENVQKRTQIKANRAQVAGVTVSAVVSVAAFVLAGIVACQGQQTVNQNTQSTLRQSEDNQLSTAITALGSGNMAERIAGLQLLEQNASSRIAIASKTGEPPADVFTNYQTALRIFSGYLRSQGQDFLNGTRTTAAAPFGRGYGVPAPPGLPIDINYAGDQVKYLLTLQNKVTALNSGQPVIDLSHDELFKQSWPGINFGWITPFMPGIDLRGSNLESAHWANKSDLTNSYLQCADLKGAQLPRADLGNADLRGADLQGAVFRKANLSNADLRGANVQGANFSHAGLHGVKASYVYGVATWLRPPRGMRVLPVAQWENNRDSCLANRAFWDNLPAAPGPSPSG